MDKRTSHPTNVRRHHAAGLFVILVCLALAGCASTPSPATAPAFNLTKHVVPTTKTRMAILRAAAAQLGKRYRANATGPATFSDNGLVRYAYTQAGIRLPLAPHALLGAGDPVSLARAQPADLLFFQTQLAGGADSLRVGLYLNSREMLFASPRSGRVVLQSISGSYWRGRLLGAVQVLP